MKAVVCHKPGPPEVLELDGIEMPVVPDDGVLVRVQAASVNPVDLFPWRDASHYAARPLGLVTL